MIKALGAEPVELPYGQVLTGLATKLIDGAENNWPSFVTTDHYKHAGYYTLTEHTMSPEVLVMSLKAWESLSSEDRKIFRDAARESSRFMRERWQALEEQSRRQAEAAGVDDRDATSTASRSKRRWRASTPKPQRDPAAGATDRTHSQGGVNWPWQRPSTTMLRHGRRASPHEPCPASSSWSARCRSAGASCRLPR